ncbi:MAG: hypothetical protein KIH65_002965 [Candidatus Uhrbacteria bacterium]|nr:hypothetical protein [Candidatus Uhrbacteria bacterium]
MNTNIDRLFLIVGVHVLTIFGVNIAFRLIEPHIAITTLLIAAFAMFALTIGTSWTSWKCLCIFTDFGDSPVATWIPCAILLVAIHSMCHSFGIQHIVLNILTILGILASLYKANPIHIPSQE